MSIPQPISLHVDRLFPADPTTRDIARRLYSRVEGLPIISPHGHTDPRWFAENKAFANPAALLIQPDHYLLRMLYSQGVSLAALGIKRRDQGGVDTEKLEDEKQGRQQQETLQQEPQEIVETDPRAVWRCFAQHYYLFRGTPSRLWLDYVFAEVFGLTETLCPANADSQYDAIAACLQRPEFLPQALFERFNIEVLATTESPLDDLRYHRQIQQSDWSGRVITAFRPDNVIDPEIPEFRDNVRRLGKLSGEDVSSFAGYLRALVNRRAYFIEHGATSTDHGHPTPATADLSEAVCEKLYQTVMSDKCSLAEAELFRAQMLTEMASMSLEDGLVMQIHPGCYRNHNADLLRDYGRDKGADLPLKTEYTRALRPLLNKYGSHPKLSIILFTLDETTYSRELAPLAGHYPALKLGPAWWFHDSPEGMRRYREQVTETAGFYNTVGFNDDTRAFLSIPARHDLARRMDCTFLAQLVAEHRLSEDEANELIVDLSYNLAKRAYKL